MSPVRDVNPGAPNETTRTEDGGQTRKQAFKGCKMLHIFLLENSLSLVFTTITSKATTHLHHHQIRLALPVLGLGSMAWSTAWGLQPGMCGQGSTAWGPRPGIYGLGSSAWGLWPGVFGLSLQWPGAQGKMMEPWPLLLLGRAAAALRCLSPPFQCGREIRGLCDK